MTHSFIKVSPKPKNVPIVKKTIGPSLDAPGFLILTHETSLYQVFQ